MIVFEDALGKRGHGVRCRVARLEDRGQPGGSHRVSVEELVGPLGQQQLWRAGGQGGEDRAAATVVHDEIRMAQHGGLVDERLDVHVR